jgi:hypothetical protein
MPRVRYERIAARAAKNFRSWFIIAGVQPVSVVARAPNVTASRLTVTGPEKELQPPEPAT